MKTVKKENPDANWKNLITGIVILVLLGVFSVWYFSSDDNRNGGDLFTDVSNDIVLNETPTKNATNGQDSTQTTNEEIDGPFNAPANTEGMTTVQDGEGLWQVAERVCGNAEAYVYLAEANNMSFWWAPLTVGQELAVNCGDTK